MPDRVITVIKDWGQRHQREDKAKTIKFLIRKRQHHDWENNNLQHDEGLIESEISQPDIPAEFPGIDLESEQPHHHQVVEVIEESDDERIYAAQQNASLDDLPRKPTGVSTTVDEVEGKEDEANN